MRLRIRLEGILKPDSPVATLARAWGYSELRQRLATVATVLKCALASSPSGLEHHCVSRPSGLHARTHGSTRWPRTRPRGRAK
jgi:hypothetical protein